MLDVVRAFLALLALLVLLAGVPVALTAAVGLPLPSGPPTVAWLQQEVTAHVFVGLLGLLVWLAWAQFTACVLVETVAAVRGAGVPARVPGSGPSQLLARRLVAALLLAGAVAASVAPSPLEYLRQPVPSAAVTAPQAPGLLAGHGEEAGFASVTVEEQARRTEEGARSGSTKFYRVRPPEGRHHDSLWEIAERHLGDGRRYKEIHQLNKDREQPDGSRLSKASLIRPGWIMEMPADARGGELVDMGEVHRTFTPEGPEHAPAGPSSVEDVTEYAKTGDAVQGRTGPTDRDTAVLLLPGLRAQAGNEDRSPAPNSVVLPAVPSPRTDASAPSSSTARAGGGAYAELAERLVAAPLLAAGLLAAVGARRRQALWQSAMRSVRGVGGAADPLPVGAAEVHDALLTGADPEGVRLLDRALREVAVRLAEEARGLPVVHSAWLDADGVRLRLGQPAGAPPAPWREEERGSVWRLSHEDVTEEHHEGPAVPAPFPALVSLGAENGSRLLLNLASAPGLIRLRGSAEDRAAVLASVAAELATSGWSDQLTVTLVGFGADLVPLAPQRIRQPATVAELLRGMETETGIRRAALGAAGHDGVLTGRAGAAGSPVCTPHLVLIASELDEEEASRLSELAQGADRWRIGYLVGSDGRAELADAAWDMEITADGRLLAPLLAPELRAQLLPAAQLRAVVELFRSADRSGRPDPRSGEDAAGVSAFLVDITERGRPAVYARLLGRYEIIGPPLPDGERSALLHEALAFLLLRRQGVHPRVLAAALWPRGVTDEVRHALLGRLREWLGDDPDGAPRLRDDADGRLVLSRSVVCDLDVLRSLHHEATRGRAAVSGARGRLLADALELARGPLLPDRPAGRYAWLVHETVDVTLPLLVADIGLELAAFHRERGRPESAVQALRSAKTSAPHDERLWNELLRTTHLLGDESKLYALASELKEDAGARGLPSATSALLDELLPPWRNFATVGS